MGSQLESGTCRICFKHVNLIAAISRLRRENIYLKERVRELKEEKKEVKKLWKNKYRREKRKRKSLQRENEELKGTLNDLLDCI